MREPFKKRRTALLPEFDLFETMRWEKGRYFLLDLHKKRLERSASKFAFPFPREGIDRFLRDASDSFQRTKQYRLKLVLKRSGRINLFSWDMDTSKNVPVTICLSSKRTDSGDDLLYHKTTQRQLYDEELAIHRSKGFFDVIFMNQNGEVTEGAITNILIKKGSEYLTPPVRCGLLPGTYRSYLMAKKDFPLHEQVLHEKDLTRCDGIYLINSVQGMLPAEFRPT